MSVPRYVVAATSPLRDAWSHILSHVLRVPTEQITVAEQSNFQVLCDGAKPSTGALPMLQVLRTSTQDEELRAFLGANDAACKALVNQWVSLASRISLQPTAADEAEQILADTPHATQEFLASTPRATVADVLLYASLTADVEARLPFLAKWASFVSSDANIVPIARARTDNTAVAVAAAVAEGTTTKGAAAAAGSGLVKPSAEEIERRRLEKEKAKAEKEQQKAAQGGAATSSTEVATSKQNPNAKGSNASKVDSVDIDIRVGRIESIDRHPEADKLFVETISLGPNEPARTIVSGLVDHYKAEELLGAHVLVVCNLKAKPLKGITSHGMVLCASNEHGLKVVSPPEGTPAGERVSFGGKLSPAPPAIPSNAATIELLAHFKTTADGVVAWKDQFASVPSGPITSSLKSAVVK
jgi:aminoacyl tRNA synthase complex-interacting multifunctional protein 1